MRPRELLEFRTPQHPSLGTNNWGGASPLLARNIPKETLDQRYLRLNTVRERDQIFPTATIEEEVFGSPPAATIQVGIFVFPKNEPWPAPSQKGLIRKLLWRPNKRSATLGSKSSKRWLPKLNSKRRWPNGWC